MRNRIPVFVDGGVRRGTDEFKALALGPRLLGSDALTYGDWVRLASRALIALSKYFKRELKLAMGN